jgi:hypothetical protein
MTAANATDDDGCPPFASVTDKQWQPIKASLKDVGVNADEVRVETGLGEWPLRQALPLIAEGCHINLSVRKDSPTPKQLVAKQSRTIKLCKDLSAWLDDPCNYDRTNPDKHWLQFPRLAGLAARARMDLSAFVAELECCREELTAMGTSQGQHFQKLHVRFWKELKRVWDGNVGGKRRAKHLTNFLIACSKPFFPEETTDGAINAFIERGAAYDAAAMTPVKFWANRRWRD